MNTNLTAAMEYLPGTGWIDRPSNLQPAVADDLSCDVAVVGAGLGGMAAAFRLAELGRDVVLVDADVCGWGASARNAGYLTNTVGSDPRILTRFYQDRVRGLFRFANSAVRFSEELMTQHSIECDYERTGIFGAAVTTAQLNRMKRAMKPGARTQVVDSRAAGVPPSFRGGLHMRVGGVLNPGKFALGVRDAVLTSGVRVFERTPVRRVVDNGTSVAIDVPGGTIRAEQVLLTTNAFTNTLDIAPRWLSTPVRVTAVETQPVAPELLDAAGWTSRTPIVTTHLVMESYRTTSRGTIVISTRKLQMPSGPMSDRQPDQSIVAELVRAFRERFPTLGDVHPEKTWGGWIGLTPSNLAVAGQATPRVFYSMACNGHGLPQAPYLGTLVADHIGGKGMHDDLKVLWRKTPRFAPGVVNPFTVRAAWLVDRVLDRLDQRR